MAEHVACDALDKCMHVHAPLVHTGARMHETSSYLIAAASLALLMFAALSALDGIYIHLIRLKLHAHAASWLEHLWHTGRALLFVPILLTLFAVVSGGALLWTGIALLVLDQTLELLDMTSEKRSRERLGGLSSFEYVVHVSLTTLRTAAVALSLAARPASAYALSSPYVVGTLPAPWAFLVHQLVPGAIAVGVLHVWLAIRHRPQRCPCLA